MKVLITGAAGFLGRWFVRHHIEAGDRVCAIDDLSAAHATPPPYRHGFIQGDAGFFFKDNQLDFDLAYHFAAPVGGRIKIESDPMFNADSLRLDAAFFRWAKDHAKVAVYPSSSAVYGIDYQRAEDGRPLAESLFEPHALYWAQPDELYGFTKMAGEVLAVKAAQYGLATLCIRPFSGYGPGQPDDYPVTAILQRAMNREDPLVVWGDGSQKRDFVYVEDIVRATIARLGAGIDGYQVMNIGSGQGHSFPRLAKNAAKIVGYEPDVVRDRTKPMGVAVRVADIDRMSRFIDPASMTPFKEGLEKTIKWLAKEA